jgi:beta-lactam-binding protein with PASTA domain
MLLLFFNVTEGNVPNVVGLDIYAATVAIVGGGFILGTTLYAYSSSVDAGKVLSQSRAGGSSAVPGTAIQLTISLGVQPVVQTTTVPNVVGLNEWVARFQLNAADLILNTTQYSFSVGYPNATVIAQSLAAGSVVPLWTPIFITVSNGYP